MNEVSGEHQTWLSQVRRLQITVPTDTIPSTAELKEWAISWLRSDERWVKPRTDDDDRLLVLHRFDMRKLVNEGRSVPFVMANLIPGGKFVVILYTDGQIDLKEIKTESEDNWDLRDVAEYIQDDPENTHTMFWSQLLTETNVGRPLIAYVDRDQEKYDPPFLGTADTALTKINSAFLFSLLTTLLASSNRSKWSSLMTYFFMRYTAFTREGTPSCVFINTVMDGASPFLSLVQIRP